MATIGFIGLGRMGRPMASNLCRKGFSLIVHDIDRAPVRAVEQLGARAATRVSDLARGSVQRGHQARRSGDEGYWQL